MGLFAPVCGMVCVCVFCQMVNRLYVRSLEQVKNPRICGSFRGALGRTRTCDLLIRGHFRFRTRSDTEGHGETNLRFYRYCATPEGTGEDREGHPVAVRLRSEGDLVLFRTYIEGVAA